mgnify:CR=1 FL=1
MKVFGVVKKAPAVARNVGGNQGGGNQGGGSGSSVRGAGASTGGGTSSGSNDIPTESDTGAFFGPNLPTPQETARAKLAQDTEDRHAQELAAAGTEQEKDMVRQKHAAERDREEQQTSQDVLATKMKERRAAKLTGKKMELPIAPQLPVSLVVPDSIEGREFRTLERGKMFQPGGKGEADLKAGIKNIESKIQKLDSETGFKRLDARKDLLDERLKLLSHPDIVKYIGFIEKGPQPILHGGYPERTFDKLPVEYTKYPRRDIGEDRLAFLNQIPGAVREVTGNYVTLDPLIIKKEIDKTKAAADPIKAQLDKISTRREQLTQARGQYMTLLAPKAEQEVTESKKEGAEPKQKSTEKTSIR